MAARIVIVSGACGTGKTSIACLLAKNSTYAYAVHIHTDDFYQYIGRGYPLPKSDLLGSLQTLFIFWQMAVKRDS